MIFHQLLLRKIIKTVATRCHILRFKYIKFDFGWGSTPNPTGRTYSAPIPSRWIRGGRGEKGEREGGKDGIGR